MADDPKKKKTHKRKDETSSAVKVSALKSSDHGGESDTKKKKSETRESTIHHLPPPEKVVFPIAISVQLSINSENNVTHISVVGDNSVAWKSHAEIFSAATGLGGLAPVFESGYSVDIPSTVQGDSFVLSKARAISGLVEKLLTTYDLKHIDSTNNKTLLVFVKS